MTKRKSFTLVELLVVIAILGILATVSILSYNNLKDKGYSAADLSYVSELNLALSLDNEHTVETVSDALYVLALEGIVVKPSQARNTKFMFDTYSRHIVYVDSSNNCLNYDNNIVGSPSEWLELDYQTTQTVTPEEQSYSSLFN